VSKVTRYGTLQQGYSNYQLALKRQLQACLLLARLGRGDSIAITFKVADLMAPLVGPA
jgi:hypothetical protein